MPIPLAPEPISAGSPFRIEGHIPRRRVPFAYRAGLGAVALAMVLLPLLYVGLIVLVAYGVYYYAIHAVVIFETDGGGWLKLFIYIAPLFIGFVIVAFMVKPLFTRASGRNDAVEIDLEANPNLRDVITGVCGAVGAPMPVCVEINCDVNAGARLRRGFWSLGRRDLVLCIGLPLIRGFTLRQLAGVLAHEFGHFAQPAGMAFTYVIRRVNLWFARVVFERDDWDRMLEEGSQKGDYRIMALLACARGGLWLSRQILRGLMNVGHAVSCLQLRQMEFDADYYETALVGAETFASTARELNRLNVAAQIAYNDLQGLWRTRKAVDDIAGLIVNGRAALASELLTKVDAQLVERATRWLDTHPSDAQRIAHAERLGMQPLFTAEGPATLLLTEVENLGREATARFYESRGLTVNPNAIVSAARLRESAQLAEAVNAAWARLGGTVINLARPLRWTAADFTPTVQDPIALAAELAWCRTEMERHRKQALADEESHNAALEHVNVLERARVLISCGVKINPRSFRLEQSNLLEAETELAGARERLTTKAQALAPFETAVRRWISLVGAAARTPAIAVQWPAPMRSEAIKLSDALVSHDPWFRDFPDWMQLAQSLHTYRTNDTVGSREVRFIEAARKERERARLVVDNAVQAVANVGNPFESTEPRTTGDVTKKALEGTYGDGRLAVLMQQAVYLYFQLLGRVAVYGEELERQLASSTSLTPMQGTVPPDNRSAAQVQPGRAPE